MKIRKILALPIWFLCGAVFVFGQGPAQVVYDPTAQDEPMKISPAEESLIKRQALPKARKVWKTNESCSEDFRLVDSAEGSFTRKGARQKAFLYEFCQTGNGWANNGLVIAEGGKILAHFVEEGGWNLGLRRLPDVNRNGFDELAVETSGGMHQGKTGGSVTIIEVSPATVKELGLMQAFSNECDAEESAEDCDKSYRITVIPSVRPVFYREKFINRGDDLKPRWRRSGKPQKVSLRKTEHRYRRLG